MQPDGYVKIKDRSKDIIISGGENISSLEVEDVLYRHPAVLTAAVVAQPDPKWGETPCAFVELKPGASATEAELIAHCQDAAGAIQGTEEGRLRRVAEDLHRQDPEIPAARTGEVDVGDRVARLLQVREVDAACTSFTLSMTAYVCVARIPGTFDEHLAQERSDTPPCRARAP